MKYLKYSVLVMLVFLIAGCGTKDPLAPAQAPVIMPLNVGNRWVYNVNIYSPTSPTPTSSLIWAIQVVASETIDNRAWYRSLHIVTDGLSVDTMTVYYANFSDGLYLSYLPSDTSYLKLRYPVTSGDTFTGANEWYGSNLSTEVMSTNSSVTVPLGTYQCVYYKSPYSTYRLMHEYYKPNTGMVKMEWEYYNATYGWYTDVLFELVEMSLN